jgi:tetratricopeptide (TPR) repeat protein
MRYSHILCLFAGGGVVAAIWFQRGTAVEPAVRAPAAQVSSPDPRLDEIAARLDELLPQLAKIDGIAARLDEVEHALAEVRAAEPKVVVIEPPAPLQARQRAEAFALTRAGDRAPEALEAWRAIEEASADPKRRAEACFEQGEIHRKLEDWNSAADAFRKVVDQIGLGSERGQTATYQLGWCEVRRGDNVAAYDAFRRLCEAPHLTRTAAPVYRYQMAVFALAAGEVDAARRELERYVADYRDQKSEHVQAYVKSASEKLAQLK